MSILIAALLFVRCSSPKKTGNASCGYASTQTRFRDSSTGKFVAAPNITDFYFWYRDSLIVYCNYVLDTDTGPDGKTDYVFSITHYTFLDLRTKNGYDYLHFSDTAKCIKARVIVPDYHYGKIWAFYGFLPYDEPDSTVKKMPDTTINKITYQRYSMYNTVKHDDGDNKIYQFEYLNCNAAHPMFQFDKTFSARYGNGCPIQRNDTYWSKTKMYMTGEFAFHRNTLTAQETKTFDAWEKYAKEHPVKN